MRISDWSSDVCSSDLCFRIFRDGQRGSNTSPRSMRSARRSDVRFNMILTLMCVLTSRKLGDYLDLRNHRRRIRSEEHTSELQSLMRTSYAVFCLKKKTKICHNTTTITNSPVPNYTCKITKVKAMDT